MQPAPNIRSLRARITNLERSAAPGYDGKAATQEARLGYWRKLEAEVDPEGRLPPEERRRKATALFQARMARGKLEKASARRKR
jgi:hypothetical protein